MVSRTVSFSSADGLRTESLKHLVTGTDFATHSTGAVEFSFDASGRHYDGHSKWTFSNADTVPLLGGEALRIQLRNEPDELNVAISYAAYDDEPALRQWLRIKNTGRQPITLSRLAFARLDGAPGDAADLHVMSGYGAVPHESFMTGRVSDAAIFLRDSRTHEGFAVVNEAPGYLKRTEMDDEWRNGLSLMYDTDLFPFERSGRTAKRDVPGQRVSRTGASLTGVNSTLANGWCWRLSWPTWPFSHPASGQFFGLLYPKSSLASSWNRDECSCPHPMDRKHGGRPVFSASFPPCVGRSVTFACLALASIIQAAFTLFFVPETKINLSKK